MGAPHPTRRGQLDLPPEADPLLHELGAAGVHRRPVALEDVRLPPSTLDAAPFAAVVGEDAVRTDRLTRVAHAAGRSYLDLVRLRAGDATGAPDAVVAPGSPDEVVVVLAALRRQRRRRRAVRRRHERGRRPRPGSAAPTARRRARPRAAWIALSRSTRAR